MPRSPSSDCSESSDRPRGRRAPRKREKSRSFKRKRPRSSGSSSPQKAKSSSPRRRPAKSNFSAATSRRAAEPAKQETPFVLYHNRPGGSQRAPETVISRPEKEPELPSLSLDVPNALVNTLMTSENRELLRKETGAAVEWMPSQAKVRVSGTSEQIEKAQRLVARVSTHCCWGVSAEKIQRLLKPRKVESVQLRLSPMDGKLPPCKKQLNEATPTVSMGKGPGNDVVLPNPYGVVSRQHAAIELDQDRGAVYVHDLSTNGLFLNGVRLPAQQGGKVLLSHGDELLFTDPATGTREFGYIVNIQELSVKEEVSLEGMLPRRRVTEMDRKIIMPDLGW